MSKTIYIQTKSKNPYYNLAFEEFVLCNRLDGDYLLLWQNDNTIVVGKNQNTEAEINKNFVKEHNINVVRRTTGGGAVYHDLGNLNYSFITDAEKSKKNTLEKFTSPIVDSLKVLGISAEASGRNDILIEGLKISGTAQRLYKNRILHHGTLLFNANPSMIAGALNVDAEKFKDKSAKSVRSRVGNIKDFLEQDMSLEEFWEYLKESLLGNGMTETTLNSEELEAVKKLKQEKYDTWEWNYGNSPKYSKRNKYKYDGGIIEVLLEVVEGRIKDIKIYGDFLAISPIEEVIEELKGSVYEEKAIGEVLDNFNVINYFGGITKEEIIKTIY